MLLTFNAYSPANERQVCQLKTDDINTICSNLSFLVQAGWVFVDFQVGEEKNMPISMGDFDGYLLKHIYGEQRTEWERLLTH